MMGGMPYRLKAAEKKYKHLWYLRNRASVLRRVKRRYLRCREEIIAAVSRWAQKNREKVRRTHRRWEKRNPQKCCAQAAIRRARKRGGGVGNRKDITAVYSRCQELRQWFDVVVDHIVPLAKGGAHSPENLQIIYRSENQLKGARLDYVPVVVFN
jgi:5-methylcytosine-specific restriction endonuclease McrA